MGTGTLVPQRVSVVGASGSGKTGLARAIGAAIGAPVIELDAIMHQAGWQPNEDFVAEVESATRGDAWVVDGNYSQVTTEGPVWQRADTLVWLDLPRRTVMRQVVLRTARRVLTREVLWNGNRESIAFIVSRDPVENLILWTWLKYPEFVDRYSNAMRDPAWSHLRFIRLRSHREARAWLEAIPKVSSRARP
jgi:adenylate kinase family enzyme